MEFDLTPKLAQTITEVDGGAYYSWSVAESPSIRQANVGAGKLVLQPRGFALPHYADSSKLGYVLQGCDGVVGMVLPNSAREVVLKLEKGDVIPVSSGSVSWWFNDGDSELVIVFLGETSKSYIPGEFTYFFLCGVQGIMGGFSPEFLSRAYNTNTDEANKLTKSQTAILITQLPEGTSLPKPNVESTHKMVYDIDGTRPDVRVKDGGVVTALTENKFPFLGEVQLSANLVKLDAKAMRSPSYTADSAVQVIYVVKGSGHVQIVGINGKRVLDAELKPGHLFVVPRFFVVAELAGGDGLECFSIITSKQAALQEFAGQGSAWEAFSPAVIQASLNVSAEFGEVFKSKMQNATVLIPPQNESKALPSKHLL